ncbi:MAG TPA: hypothetical protein VHK69_04870, partial [Chitinophagaceae bacterium]|nr:hypothetical protein [Chitinophagaceae bacterium]
MSATKLPVFAIIGMISFLFSMHNGGAQVTAGTADYKMAGYDNIMKKAEQLEAQKDFEAAIVKLNAAKVLQPQKGREVDNAILRIYKKINQLRKDAEARQQQIEQLNVQMTTGFRKLASETLLTDAERVFNSNYFDINTSYLITEFVSKYIDHDNEHALRVLLKHIFYKHNNIDFSDFDRFYRNDSMPLNYRNINVPGVGSIKQIKLYANGSRLMVYTKAENIAESEIVVFDVASQKVVTSIPLTECHFDELSIYPESNVFFTVKKID